MIVVDKLCYRSKLRYVNAGEKFVFSMVTLLFCIISRSFLIAAIAFFVNGFLVVKKGGISFGRYIRLLAVPFTFLILSTLAVIVNISRVPLDAYAVPVGTFFITGSRESLWFGMQLIGTAMASVSCLYFILEHHNDGYTGCVGSTALPRNHDRINDADIPFYLCADGDGIVDHGLSKVQTRQPELKNINSVIRTDGGRAFHPGIETVQRAV